MRYIWEYWRKNRFWWFSNQRWIEHKLEKTTREIRPLPQLGEFYKITEIYTMRTPRIFYGNFRFTLQMSTLFMILKFKYTSFYGYWIEFQIFIFSINFCNYIEKGLFGRFRIQLQTSDLYESDMGFAMKFLFSWGPMIFDEMIELSIQISIILTIVYRMERLMIKIIIIK